MLCVWLLDGFTNCLHASPALKASGSPATPESYTCPTIAHVVKLLASRPKVVGSKPRLGNGKILSCVDVPTQFSSINQIGYRFVREVNTLCIPSSAQNPNWEAKNPLGRQTIGSNRRYVASGPWLEFEYVRTELLPSQEIPSRVGKSRCRSGTNKPQPVQGSFVCWRAPMAWELGAVASTHHAVPFRRRQA